ncbi:vascular endothelial growth factor A-like [Toxotes jaculatrix]|uniref:vascular endothelial growth factor A-like n=1 Tax=Toxotes jaculatrix TaxID=941984 RepID=UPI001B3A98EC|nr:vascular endothelial growth factor A-like [Toxotes jaculatrix]
MQSFIGISHLLLVLLVQLVPAQISPAPEEAPPREMTLQEVFAKSMCHPMEQLVDVEQELPGEVGYIYWPACVPLLRCSGCCGDEYLECHPILERNITVEMMRIIPMKSSQRVELTFVEHQSCECRLRPTPQQNKRSGESIKNKSRRKKHKMTSNGCDKCQFSQNKISLH